MPDEGVQGRVQPAPPCHPDVEVPTALEPWGFPTLSLPGTHILPCPSPGCSELLQALRSLFPPCWGSSVHTPISKVPEQVAGRPLHCSLEDHPF